MDQLPPTAGSYTIVNTATGPYVVIHRSLAEIMAQRERAIAHVDNDTTNRPGDTFPMGVEETLTWLLGLTESPPMPETDQD